MASKKVKHVWFKQVRGSYLPVSAIGWLAYIPFTGYLVFSFWEGIYKTSSTALAALVIVPNWIVAAVTLTYVASRNSSKPS